MRPKIKKEFGSLWEKFQPIKGEKTVWISFYVRPKIARQVAEIVDYVVVSKSTLIGQIIGIRLDTVTKVEIVEFKVRDVLMKCRLRQSDLEKIETLAYKNNCTNSDVLRYILHIAFATS